MIYVSHCWHVFLYCGLLIVSEDGDDAWDCESDRGGGHESDSDYKAQGNNETERERDEYTKHVENSFAHTFRGTAIANQATKESLSEGMTKEEGNSFVLIVPLFTEVWGVNYVDLCKFLYGSWILIN